MTDIHSHILFDVDDGARDIEESIEILDKMSQIGFNKVVLTPHYIKGSEYCSENEEKRYKFNRIKEELENRNIKIDICLGNEIFINNEIASLVEQDIIHTMNSTQFVLVELPFNNEIRNLEDVLYELKIKGFIPIIAHPERYVYLQEDYDKVDEWREEGFLFQANYASILGYYGKDSQKLIKYMLKKQYIDYFGTDVHRTSKMYVLDNFKKIEKEIIKITKKDYYEEILDNADRLVS